MSKKKSYQLKLDIVIPTKDRYDTLVPSVNAILNSLISSEYRLIIYDNSFEDGPVDQMNSIINDSRVLYVRDNENIDAVENFNRAIGYADSKFTILIGDDDLILPNIFEVITKMEMDNLDCLIQHRPTYYWPNVKFDFESDYFSPASLQISNQIARAVEPLDSKIELTKVLNSGAIYLYDLPALYHGLLRTSVLDKIQKKYTTYVNGPSPDISLAFMIAITIKTYGRYCVPFSLAGASFNSAAGLGRRSEHSATLDQVPSWLPGEMMNDWDPKLPRLWNGFTVYAQSIYLCAKKANINVNLNYNQLYLKILSENFRDIKFFRRSESRVTLKKVTIIIGFISFLLRSFVVKLPKKILNILIRKRPAFKFLAFYKNVNSPKASIESAMVHINEHLSGSFHHDPSTINQTEDTPNEKH